MKHCIKIFISLFVISFQGESFAEEKYYVVQEALSGDTIKLTTGTILRYSSLRAPDLNSEKDYVRTYAEESKSFNENLVVGKKIRVEWGAKLKDDLGNYMPYVFLEDGTFVNEVILKEGYAKLFIKPPNIEYSEVLKKASSGARRYQAGLWVYEDEFKSDIGVIGNKSTKKYYYPDDPEILKIPKPHREEFISPVTATAAGYKPSYEYRNRQKQETDLY